MRTLEKSDTARKDQILDLIEQTSNYEAPFRLPIKERVDLLKLASDTPSPDQIKLPDSVFTKLNIKLTKKNVQHFPFVASLIEREVGANIKSIKQVAIKATDSVSLRTKKAQKIQKLQNLINQELQTAPEQVEAHSQIQAQIEKILNTDIQLEAEKKASMALDKFIHFLEEDNDYLRSLYSLKSIGETFQTVDIFGTRIEARECNSSHLYFLPGKIPTDLKTSPQILEDLFWDIGLVLDRFDLSFKTQKKLVELSSASKTKHVGQGSTLHDEVSGKKSITDLMSAVKINPELFGIDGATGQLQDSDYDEQSGLVKIQKLTVKVFNEKKKVYKTIVDSDNSNFELKSKFYKAKKGEKVESMYVAEWYVAYYIPAINEIVQEEYLDQSILENFRSENYLNLYSGNVKTINGFTPYSWLNNVKDLIYLRDLLLHQIKQLVADNLGIVLNLETAAQAKGFELKQTLESMINTKLIVTDLTRHKNSIDGEAFPVGKVIPKPISLYDLDNTQGILRLFNALAAVDQNIYSGKGVSEESLGNIGQNARIANVNYAVQQEAHVNTSTVVLYYKSWGRLYQNIIEALRGISNKKEIKLNELLGDPSIGTELSIGTSEFKSVLLGVTITTSLEELKLLEEAKMHAQTALLNDKTLGYDTYVKTLKSHSLNEIINILDEAKKQAMQSQQQAQKEQMQAAKEAQQLEADLKLQEEKLKISGDIEVAKINKDREVETSKISADSRERVAEINTNNKNGIRKNV